LFERKADLSVVYAPWDGLDPDDAVRLAARWLAQQPGQKLVLLHAKKMYTNNSLLPRLTNGAFVEKPDSVWRSGWRGGSVLAPWPSEEVLGALSDRLARMITSVCVIEWGEDPAVQAWLEAYQAMNLMTGRVAVGDPSHQLSPVVRVAMEHLSSAVNHNNALVQSFEKSYAVRTLQELHRAGHTFDVDDLCAWALANGFTQSEVKNLRDYGMRVQQGRGFRLRDSVGPSRGAAGRWEAEAATED
jgi:hypothetical protein